MDEPIEVVVPPAHYPLKPVEMALWISFGIQFDQAVQSVGKHMAISIMASRLTREIRREIGVAGARTLLTRLAETMEEAARYDT